MGTQHIIGWKKNAPYKATATAGDAHTDTIAVGVVLKDYAGNALTAKRAVFAYFSEDADGLSVSTTSLYAEMTASVGDVCILEATNQYLLVCSTSGTLTLSVQYQAGAKDFYLVLVMPTGEVQVSDKIEFEN